MPSGSYNEFGAQTGNPGTLPGHGPIVVTAFSESLLDNSTLAEWQTDLGISAGLFQPIDAGLTSISALVTAANKGIYTTALDTYATFDLTAFARTLLDDADAPTMRTTLGVPGLSGSNTFVGPLLIGTPLTGVNTPGAGDLALEGNLHITGTLYIGPNADEGEASFQIGNQTVYYEGAATVSFGGANVTVGGLLSQSSTFSLLNSTATTINFAGAATTLNIGSSAAMVLNFGGGATAAEFRFLEPSGSGTNYTAFKAQAQAGNITYTLPAANASGVLVNNGSGVLSFGSSLSASGLTYTSTGTGASSQALQSVFDNIPITPEMFGAAGDDSTDDTAAVLAAVVAAYAQDRVLYLPNSYKISDEILLDKPGLRIIGVHDDQSSPSKVRQTATNKSAFRIVNEAATSSNNFITFQHLLIVGPGLATSTMPGVHIDSDGSTFFDEINFEHVQITGFDKGLLAERWSNGTCYQCTFYQNNWGVETTLGLCNAVEFRNCWFGANTNTGTKIGSANSQMAFRSCEWNQVGFAKMMYISGAASVLIDGGNSEGGSGIGSDGTSGILCEVGAANAKLVIKGFTFLAGTTSAIPIRCSAANTGVVVGMGCVHSNFDAAVPFAQTYRSIAPYTRSDAPGVQIDIYSSSAFTGTPDKFYSMLEEPYLTADVPAASATMRGHHVWDVNSTNDSLWVYGTKSSTVTKITLTPTQVSNDWWQNQFFSASHNAIGTSSATTGAHQLDLVQGSGQVLRMGSSTANDGGFLQSRAANQLELNGGSYFNGAAQLARSTSASKIWMAGSAIAFYADSGLTAGNTFTSTERFRVNDGGVIVNDLGLDNDFRVEGDTDANLLFTDASTDRVGIGTSTPAVKLDVIGAVNRRAGTSSSSGNVPCILYQAHTPVGNVGAGEDTLFTQSVAANVLATNGDRLRVTVPYHLASGSDTNSDSAINLKWAGVTFHTVLLSGDPEEGDIVFWITRTGAATQQINGRVKGSGGTDDYIRTTGAATLSNANTLAITGIGDTGSPTDDDAKIYEVLVEYIPAP